MSAKTFVRSGMPLCAILLLSAGCTPPAPPPAAEQPAAETPSVVDQILPPVPAAQPVAPAVAPVAPPADAAAPVDPAAAAAPDTVQTKADVGAGKRGRNLGQGPIATPITTYFVAQELVSFRAMVPQAMNLYKATNGYAPKTHDEFMKEIIRANNIKLPELPPGHTYVYVPETEELMVEKPAE